MNFTRFLIVLLIIIHVELSLAFIFNRNKGGNLELNDVCIGDLECKSDFCLNWKTGRGFCKKKPRETSRLFPLGKRDNKPPTNVQLNEEEEQQVMDWSLPVDSPGEVEPEYLNEFQGQDQAGHLDYQQMNQASDFGQPSQGPLVTNIDEGEDYSMSHQPSSARENEEAVKDNKEELSNYPNAPPPIVNESNDRTPPLWKRFAKSFRKNSTGKRVVQRSVSVGGTPKQPTIDLKENYGNVPLVDSPSNVNGQSTKGKSSTLQRNSEGRVVVAQGIEQKQKDKLENGGGFFQKLTRSVSVRKKRGNKGQSQTKEKNASEKKPGFFRSLFGNKKQTKPPEQKIKGNQDKGGLRQSIRRSVRRVIGKKTVEPTTK